MTAVPTTIPQELLERRRMHRRRIVPMLAELLPSRERMEMLARLAAGERRARPRPENMA